MDSRHEEAAEDDFVEGRIGTAFACQSDNPIRTLSHEASQLVRGQEAWGHTGEESVELDQKLQIDVIGLRCFAMTAAHMMAIEIDTYKAIEVSITFTSILFQLWGCSFRPWAGFAVILEVQCSSIAGAGLTYPS